MNITKEQTDQALKWWASAKTDCFSLLKKYGYQDDKKPYKYKPLKNSGIVQIWLAEQKEREDAERQMGKEPKTREELADIPGLELLTEADWVEISLFVHERIKRNKESKEEEKG